MTIGFINICNKDCEHKNNLEIDPLFLTVCNNCLHSIKRDHYLPKKVMKDAAAEFTAEEKGFLKALNFLFKGQKST